MAIPEPSFTTVERLRVVPSSITQSTGTANRSPAQTTATTRSNFRCKRGLAIFKRYAGRIKRIAPWVYSVPSQSGSGVYHVYMKEGDESCSCPDYAKNRRIDEEGWETFFCKHYFAARMWRARSEECAGCKTRLLRRRMKEVGEEHLTFYTDDYLCGECASKHGLGMAC